MLNLLINTFQQSMLFMPLVLGLYMSYRIMNITDLTVEGSFVLGAAVYARCVSTHMHEGYAILFALLACAVVGVLVALMQNKGKIEPLIASILMIFMLYSVNLKTMGQPNIDLLDAPTLLNALQNNHPTLAQNLPALIVVLLMLVTLLMMKTPLGLMLRTYGDNPDLLKKLKLPHFGILVVGLIFCNIMAGIGGIITAEVHGYADINMGTGVALTAIGSMIIGFQCMRRLHAKKANTLLDLFAALVGVMLYFAIVNTLLYFNVDPIYLKLCLGGILVLFMAGAHKKTTRPSHA
jgi:putative tryptophan/tyrosine transport system permease protein